MGFIRNAVLMGLGFLAMKAAQRVLANAEASREKVKAKADDATTRIPKLKLDPVTGVYRPEA